MTRFAQSYKSALPVARRKGCAYCMIVCLFLAACVGCTVKEDREPCPCYLDLDYTAILSGDLLDGQAGNVDAVVYLPSSEYPSTFRLAACPDINENVVDKGLARVVSVLHNRPLREMLVKGPRVTWDEGNEIDSVYVHSSDVDCRGEEAYCLLEPHKQFHTISFTDEFGGEALRTYNMVIKGSTCGFNADDFSAIEGPYLYTVQEYDRNGGVSVRVPRQIYDDLRLEFWTKEDYRRVFTCPVGQYLRATGYDKDAIDLCDFEVKVNFRDALVYVRVADWEDEYVFALFK